MAGYRYLAYDLLSHKPLAELPLTGVSYGQTLNQAGETSANLRLPNDPTLSRLFIDATIPLRRALYIERDGVLVWGGPIWQRTLGGSLKALEWWSLFSRRLVRDTAIYIGGDQIVIALDLVRQAQRGTAGAQLNIDLDGSDSGVNRDRTYNDYEANKVSEMVSQLAAVEDGFDFAIDVAYQSDGTISRTFRTSYPHRGRTGAETGLVFETGRNIVSLDWPEDGSNAANSVMALGSGDSDTMLRVTSTRPELFDEGYPLLEDSVSLRDISVEATLTEHADALTAARGVPVVLPPVTVQGNVDPVVGSYITGDEARFRVQSGQDVRFPDGLDERRRITAFTVKVPDSGADDEVVTLTTDLPLT